MSEESDDGMTYADAGVDIEASEAATAALLTAARAGETTAYAGVIEVDDLHIGLTTDGVGTKLLVAEALDRYETVGIDCIAMNVNDLVAEGLRPLGFVDYLALETPDEAVTAAIGEGLATGAERADISLMGGETAILPEVIDGVDLAGAAIGISEPDTRPVGTAAVGDVLIGVSSSGIHSNGLTLARRAITRQHGYDTPFPPDTDRTIGEVLLEPTRLYTDLVETIQSPAVNACAHITGGGITNCSRMGDFRYVIDEPLAVPPIFSFIQSCGGISEAEMYRTFNMGTGFVLAVDPAEAHAVAESIDGRSIGIVDAGHGIEIAGLELEA